MVKQHATLIRVFLVNSNTLNPRFFIQNTIKVNLVPENF